jgi:hypothetical protein
LLLESILEERWTMTRWRRVAVALLLALPIEAGNMLLSGMMLDPGPFPVGIVPRLLGAEWVFFHFLGFRMIDSLSKLFGTEKAGIVVAFVLAYLQTALVIFLCFEVVRRLRVRFQPKSQFVEARS